VFNTSATTVVNNVTRVFAVERLASGALNPANTKDATRFVVLGPTLIDAFFEFGTVNAGKTFLIFVSGPNGTSRNLVASDTRPAGCPTGNEQGIQVTFTCLSQPPPPCQPGDPPPCPAPKPPPARVNACDLNRSASGSFTLTVDGSNIKSTAVITVGGKTPKKVKFQQQQSNGTFNRVKLKGGICDGLPGPIVIDNKDGGDPSAPFQCNESCPRQQ
jgi:hypothetical protein